MKQLLILMFVTSSVSAQTYKLESRPIYDESGQSYQYRQVYGHIPTHNDSIEFKQAANEYTLYINRALLGDAIQYTAEVAEIKYINGVLAIKPSGKFKSAWYRCNDKSIKVGDSVTITKNDAIIK